MKPGFHYLRGTFARYGGLHHPGDAFCFDIFTHAARAVRLGGVLGPLPATSQAVPDGLVLAEDADEMVAVAAAGYPVRPGLPISDAGPPVAVWRDA